MSADTGSTAVIIFWLAEIKSWEASSIIFWLAEIKSWEASSVSLILPALSQSIRRSDGRHHFMVSLSILGAAKQTEVPQACHRQCFCGADDCCMQALRIFQRAVEEGHFKQQRWEAGAAWPARAEVNLHAMTAGVAILSLYSWLVGLKQRLLTQGSGALPSRLVIVSDKGKSSKEAGNLVVKEAVSAMMSHWESPFR